MVHRHAKMIVAMNSDRVIGVNGKIPWHYPEDMKLFKRLTTGCRVVMGRKTFESIGKPLPNRENVVVTRSKLPGVTCVKSLSEALDTGAETWVIGGAGIYGEATGREFVHKILVTWIPDERIWSGAVYCPSFPPAYESYRKGMMPSGNLQVEEFRHRDCL